MIPVQDLAVGQKVKLTGDVIAEVSSNPRDGSWIVVRYLSGPGLTAPAQTEEMVYVDDVLEVVGPSP
jgi:hypothetical protein